MRVYLCGDQAAGQFADQLLSIGDGKFPTDDDTSDVIQLLLVPLCAILMN